MTLMQDEGTPQGTRTSAEGRTSTLRAFMEAIRTRRLIIMVMNVEQLHTLTVTHVNQGF